MATNDRPNILVIMPDQMRADCMSGAGHPVIATPNIDRIAAEGVRFDNAYTTCPVCMPARSSVLSGLYCHNHGQWFNYGHLPAEADTYLRHVRRAGYHTCHVGKSHLYPHGGGKHLADHEPFMNALGWDEVFETTGPWATTGTDSIMTDRWKELGCLKTFRDDYRRRREAGGPAMTWPSPMPEGEALDDFVGRTALEYIEGYRREEPLLLFVGFGGPHEPWDPPERWATMYDAANMPPPEPHVEPGPWVGPKGAEYQRMRYREGILPEQAALIRARYFAKISHVDFWVGRILDACSDRGWMDNTAIVFWSDHGEMLADKDRLYKCVFYEQAARVPLIVRRPADENAGGVARALVSLVDIFPTVLELAGCPSRENELGESLLPLCDNPQAGGASAVFSEIQDTTMIRDTQYKMAVDRAGDTLLLYDMQSDPAERNNLAGKPELADIEKRLKLRMLAWLLHTRTDQKSFQRKDL